MIAIDKQAHFFSGWAIAASIFPLVSWVAIAIVFLLGVVKEVWDEHGHGTPDKWDAFATALGGVVGSVLVAVFTYFG